MNERIKELAESAGASVMERSGYTDYGTLNIDVEKFAELIVRDAADMFEVEYGSCEGLSGNRVAAVLREHFGVEE